MVASLPLRDASTAPSCCADRYCPKCKELLYEEFFVLTDLGTEFARAFASFAVFAVAHAIALRSASSRIAKALCLASRF